MGNMFIVNRKVRFMQKWSDAMHKNFKKLYFIHTTFSDQNIN